MTGVVVRSAELARSAVMKLVRDYRSLPPAGPADSPSSEAVVLAYAALDDAVEALAERAYPAPRKATAWAVLDANDNVVDVERSRVIALDIAEGLDGHRIAPLVLTGLDDVEDPAP